MKGVRGRVWGLVLGLGGLVAAGAVPLAAQEPKGAAPADPPAAKRVYNPARRVPPYFGQIGLSQDQREKIYEVRARHLEKIEALEKQVAEAKAAMLAECESLLTDSQKQLLEARRKSATEKKKAGASAAGSPAPAKPAEKAGG